MAEPRIDLMRELVKIRIQRQLTLIRCYNKLLPPCKVPAWDKRVALHRPRCSVIVSMNGDHGFMREPKQG